MANMNKKNRTQPLRTDPNFLKELRELAKFRYLKNLEKKEPTDAEMTRLMMKTNSWNSLKFELRTKKRGDQR